MTSDDTSRPVRPIRVLTTGGTIAMAGAGGATPELNAGELLSGIPGLAVHQDLVAAAVTNKPSAHLTLEDQLLICRTARDLARQGYGVVVTHGTDALEETAMLCDVLHDAAAPIVFTGAIRPASAAGADGPANIVDAASVAASSDAVGLGTLVVFGGEIHHARCARKTDTTSLVAFSSPQTGPLGRVTEGHATIWSRVPRNVPVDPHRLDKRVVIVPTFSGDDGLLARAALATNPDGVVLGTLGGGHMTPDLLDLWAEKAAEMPIVVYCRPERGTVLTSTYGYEASERDLREAGVIPAGFLSPQAIRMKLLACLSADLDIAAIRHRFSQDDG